MSWFRNLAENSLVSITTKRTATTTTTTTTTTTREKELLSCLCLFVRPNGKSCYRWKNFREFALGNLTNINAENLGLAKIGEDTGTLGEDLRRHTLSRYDKLLWQSVSFVRYILRQTNLTAGISSKFLLSIYGGHVTHMKKREQVVIECKSDTKTKKWVLC